MLSIFTRRKTRDALGPLHALALLMAAAFSPPIAAEPANLGEPGDSGAGMDGGGIAERFSRYLEDTLLEYTPGMAVAIVQKDRPSHIHTYGIRRLGSPELVNPHTTFRLASLSKAFAAAAAGIAVNEGALEWDSKLNAFMPEISLKDRGFQEAISVRHILSNSTGLMPHTYTNLVEDNVPYQRILGQLDKVDFVCAPGECYTYQNVVYSFIGDILQRATGQDYTSLVEQRLFGPLRMTDASATLEDFIAGGNLAMPHQRRRLGLAPTEVEANYYSVAPAAGINASISDMEQWLHALLGGRPDILPPAVLGELFASHTPVRERGYYRGSWKHVKASGYGLGWRVFDYAGTNVIFHSGWVDGYHAEIVLIPSRGLGMALLMNSDHINGITAAPKFVDISLGLER